MPAMIVAPEPLAVEEGAKVLMQGGNAVDAALVCALVEGIVNPHNAGIAGYLTLTARLTDAAAPAPFRPIALDAPALAGSKATPEMWQSILIGPNPDGWGFFLQGKVNDAGYQSICTPGFVKGAAAILETWGTLSWVEALAPAARIADEGFIVDEHTAMQWKRRAAYSEACSLLDYVKTTAEASRIYLKPDGAPYDTGERLHNPDLARSLRRLAQHGPEDFYRGDLAQQMTADLAAHGSLVTADDLRAYALRPVQEQTGTYRGYSIQTSVAPHGGPTLIEILNILEGYDLAGLGHNSPAYIHLVAMAMKAAFADRNPTLGDPSFVDVPLDWMTSKQRAAEWRAHIDAAKPIQVTFAPAGSPSTTHVTVVDSRGACVALTHSLGSSSGVITPGLGFMYNNSMTNFDVTPGRANSIAPRKARTTGMSPTIVYKNGQPVLVLGAPGATKIITSTLQVILKVLDFGMSVSDAVLAPRFDCQGDVIRCQMRIPEYICAQVRRRCPCERIPRSHGGFGLVQAIAIDPQSGRLSGASDTGCAGMPLLVA